jgi:hypothetical protein
LIFDRPVLRPVGLDFPGLSREGPGPFERAPLLPRIRVLPGKAVIVNGVNVFGEGAEVEASPEEAAYYLESGAAEIVIPSPRAAVALGPERARQAIKKGPSRATSPNHSTNG